MMRHREEWTGPGVWNGAELGKTSSWIFQLSDAHIAEIHAAVRAIHASGKALNDVSRADFPLPTLRPRLQELCDDILDGKGFVVLRGLPAHAWPHEDLVCAYWGVGSAFGDTVSQNRKGHLLGHVIDQRAVRTAETRLYQTSDELRFHSDSCDIVGLLCVRTSMQGGESALASSAAVHNYLLHNNPRALETLCGIFHCDRYGEIPAGKAASYAVRIFNEVDGKLVCCGMDPDIRSAQRLADVPRLTSDQLEALEALQETAEKLALKMVLQPGDMQFVNNLIVLHARTRFEDYAEMDRRRYMLRLWLSSPKGRRLPSFMAERWGNIEVGTRRGGIMVPGAQLVVQLDPSA